MYEIAKNYERLAEQAQREEDRDGWVNIPAGADQRSEILAGHGKIALAEAAEAADATSQS